MSRFRLVIALVVLLSSAAVLASAATSPWAVAPHDVYACAGPGLVQDWCPPAVKSPSPSPSPS